MTTIAHTEQSAPPPHTRGYNFNFAHYARARWARVDSLLVCLAAAPVARGTSSGEGIWVCRADADNLGCRSGYMMMTKRVCPSKVSLGSLLMQPCHDEQVENRGACLDEPADQSIMPWTRAPQPSAAYVLRASRDHVAPSTGAGETRPA